MRTRGGRGQGREGVGEWVKGKERRREAREKDGDDNENMHRKEAKK